FPVLCLALPMPSPVAASTTAAEPNLASKSPSSRFRKALAWARIPSSSSFRAVTIAIRGRSAADISLFAEIGDRASQSLLDRRLRQRELAHGLGGIEEHAVT